MNLRRRLHASNGRVEGRCTMWREYSFDWPIKQGCPSAPADRKACTSSPRPISTRERLSGPGAAVRALLRPPFRSSHSSVLEAVTKVGPHPKAEGPIAPRRQRPWNVAFVLLHLACQVLLLIPALSSFRVVV